jgi:hypothetical protein
MAISTAIESSILSRTKQLWPGGGHHSENTMANQTTNTSHSAPTRNMRALSVAATVGHVALGIAVRSIGPLLISLLSTT